MKLNPLKKTLLSAHFLFFIVLFCGNTNVSAYASSSIILELSYPTSEKKIQKVFSLVNSKKAKGIFLKGKWSASEIFRIHKQIESSSNEIELWSNIPSFHHNLIDYPLEFPNGAILSKANDKDLKTLFQLISEYMDKLGIDKIIWEQQSVSKINEFLLNSSMNFLINRNSEDSSVFILKDNSKEFETTSTHWEEWASNQSFSGKVIIPLEKLLEDETIDERIKIDYNTINSAYNKNTPYASSYLISSILNIYEKSILVLKNEDNIIPFKGLECKEFKGINIGQEGLLGVKSMLEKYVKVEFFSHQKGNSIDNLKSFLNALNKEKEIVIVSLDATKLSKNDLKTLSESLSQWKKDSKSKLAIQILGSTPSNVELFQQDADVIIGSAQSNKWIEHLLPQVLFGGIAINTNSKKGRLGFTLPEQVGLSSAKLSEIDSIAMLAINGDATPGCQVLVAKDGKVVFMKNYGYHSYSKQEEVTDHTLYDIASVTKVLATLPSLMYLEENDKISIEKTIADYLPDASGSNKGPMKIKDILTHQAGLLSFIPHWYQLMEDSDFDTTMVAFEQSEDFPIEVVPGLYVVHDIEEKVWDWTIDSRLTIRSKRRGMHRYFYSDLGFYIFHRLIEKVNQKPLEDFTDEYFYKPLGLQTMTYLPLEKFDRSRIAPTEMDIYFRKSLVHGTVHDPGAAMKGGVSGHAGLFSNSLDVGIMMQMFLQEGWYGNEKYLESETVKKFNTRPYAYNKNRRALGWDKPHLDGNGGATSKYCSQKTFGHTGFTGTSTWADPVNNIVYVFLSNRIHPFAGNKKLIRENIRKKIHDVIYEALIETKEQ